MKIGLTYDLRADYLAEGFTEEETAEFDHADTIEAIECALQDLGFETARIGNIKNLARRLVAGNRWDMVFNIAEGLKGFGREAQVPAMLDAYDIPYTFSDSLALSLTLNKGMAKRVIRDMGLPTPDFFVVEGVSDVEMVALPFPLFAKSTPHRRLQLETNSSPSARDSCRLTINLLSWRSFYPGGSLRSGS